MKKAIAFDPNFKNRGKGRRRGKVSVDTDAQNLTGSLTFYATPEVPDGGYVIISDGNTAKGIDEASAKPVFWTATDDNIVDIVNGLPSSRDTVSTVAEAFEFLVKHNFYVLNSEDKNIVTDSLVLDIDISNKQSYPGIGNQLYDLTNGVKPTSELRVLGAHHSSYQYPPFYNYLRTNATVTNVGVSDVTASAAYVKENFDLVIVDEYVWSMPTSIIDNLKSYVDAGVSCIGVGNDQRTHYFVASYNSSGRQSHDILMDTNSRIGLGGQTFNFGSGDVYGGITELRNGAEPLYYRTDTTPPRIMGWMYYNEESGSALYFDQEGLQSTSNAIFRSALNFVTKNTLTFGELNNGPTYNSNGWLEFDGTNDEVIIQGSDTFNSNTRTIEVLFQVTSFASGYAHLATFANGISSTDRILLTIQSGKLQWHGWGTDDPNGTTTIETGKWYKGTFTYNKSSGEMKVYTNGVLEKTITDTQKSVSGNSDNNWYLGSFGGATYGDSYSNVKISQFKQYNKILSDDEVAQNYYNGPIVNKSSSIFRHFTDTGNLVGKLSGSVVTDLSPASSDFTTEGTVTHDSSYGGVLHLNSGRIYRSQLGWYGKMAVSWWMKYDGSVNANPFYTENHRTVSGCYRISSYLQADGKFVFRVWDNSSTSTLGGTRTAITTTNVCDGDWHHVTCQWSNGSGNQPRGMYVYVDGQLEGYTDAVGNDGGYEHWHLGGAYGCVGDHSHNCYLGPVMFYKNYNLTDEEVLQNYNAHRARFGK